MLDGNRKKILDKKARPIQTREYEYMHAEKGLIYIQEHSLGHVKAVSKHGADPHFNVRALDKITAKS
ncbi:HNH/endonuclease VII fold putative polymorphic toxin [Pseudomonas massiliensis]|uniref:HNH/endonuclease VII fold putative polymorphic toxin n=1 Tax=Pseudomonas massiliensis TaxID=522492 RepID=UPI0012FC05B6